MRERRQCCHLGVFRFCSILVQVISEYSAEMWKSTNFDSFYPNVDNFFPKKCNFGQFSTSEGEKMGEIFSQFFH